MFLGSTICKIMCVGIFCRCIKKDVHLISDPLSLYIALRINDAFPLRILECIYCWLSSPQGDWHPSTTKYRHSIAMRKKFFCSSPKLTLDFLWGMYESNLSNLSEFVVMSNTDVIIFDCIRFICYVFRYELCTFTRPSYNHTIVSVLLI